MSIRISQDNYQENLTTARLRAILECTTGTLLSPLLPVGASGNSCRVMLSDCDVSFMIDDDVVYADFGFPTNYEEFRSEPGESVADLQYIARQFVADALARLLKGTAWERFDTNSFDDGTILFHCVLGNADESASQQNIEAILKSTREHKLLDLAV